MCPELYVVLEFLATLNGVLCFRMTAVKRNSYFEKYPLILFTFYIFI